MHVKLCCTKQCYLSASSIAHQLPVSNNIMPAEEASFWERLPRARLGKWPLFKQEQDERKYPKWVYLWLPRSRRSKPQNRERKGGKCEVSGCCGCPNVSPWLCVRSMVLFCILFSSASSTKLDTKFHLQGHIALAPTPGGQRAALALPEGFMAADDAEGKKTQRDFQV